MPRLFHLRRAGASFESPCYSLKWLLISTAIGLVAGAGALIFFEAIRLSTGFFLGWLVGYLPPDPAGEGTMGVMELGAAPRPWLLPVITTAGGLIAGIIVFSLAPEAEGHGTDAAIAAFHQGEPIRARIPLVKLVASAITIGSGGIFDPGMVIGAMVGATVWRISYHVLPGIPDTPAPFVIVGMMALFGGIAHAPLAVRQAMTLPPLQFSPRQSVAEAERQLAERTVGGASVLDARGNLLGVLTLADIGRVPLAERWSRRVEEVMNRDVLAARLPRDAGKGLAAHARAGGGHRDARI